MPRDYYTKTLLGSQVNKLGLLLQSSTVASLVLLGSGRLRPGMWSPLTALLIKMYKTVCAGRPASV